MLDWLKEAAALHRVQIGFVMRGSRATLKLGRIADDELAVAISPTPGDLRLDVTLDGAAQVINLAGRGVPFLVAVVPKSKIPAGVAGLTLPSWSDAIKILTSKMSLSLSAILGEP